jgi:uncharacterized membrane protein
MSNYPEVVTRIVDDYLARLKSQLQSLPNGEKQDFLLEIQSHIYEAFQQERGEDEVARILSVLRKLGEPGEVVAERLPATMISSGTQRHRPFQLLGGILLAIFGIPLGFAGAAVLMGMIAAVAGVVAGFYAVTGGVFLTGSVFMGLGLIRIYEPGFWDKLVSMGVIQMDGRLADLVDTFSPDTQGLIMLALACVFAAAGLGMLWLGKHLVRGLRLLLGLAPEGIRQIGQTIRRGFRAEKQAAPQFGNVSLNGGR